MRNYGIGNSCEDGCRVKDDSFPGLEPETEKRVEYCAKIVTVTGIDSYSPQGSLSSGKVLARSLRML